MLVIRTGTDWQLQPISGDYSHSLLCHWSGLYGLWLVALVCTFVSSFTQSLYLLIFPDWTQTYRMSCMSYALGVGHALQVPGVSFREFLLVHWIDSYLVTDSFWTCVWAKMAGEGSLKRTFTTTNHLWILYFITLLLVERCFPLAHWMDSYVLWIPMYCGDK